MTTCLVNLLLSLRRGLENEKLWKLLTLAWAADAQTTLKIIYYVRDCRGGMGERELFYDCVVWLHENHPHNVNISNIVRYGSYRDFFAIIARCDALAPKLYEYYATMLNHDMMRLSRNSPFPSLAAKWIPREGSKLNKQHNFVSKLAREMGMRSTKEFRQRVTTPLRARANMIEQKMSQNKWDEIDIAAVPSQARNKYRAAFARHGYVASQLAERDNIVRLVQHYVSGCEFDVSIERQWRELVRFGRMRGINTVPIIDISGAMTGRPACMAIAFGLYLMEISHVRLGITFERYPFIFTLSGKGTLQSKIKYIQSLPWDDNIDLDGAYKLMKLYTTLPFKFAILTDTPISRVYGHSDIEPRVVFWNFDSSEQSLSETQLGMVVTGYNHIAAEVLVTTGDITGRTALNAIIESPRYSGVCCCADIISI